MYCRGGRSPERGQVLAREPLPRPPRGRGGGPPGGHPRPDLLPRGLERPALPRPGHRRVGSERQGHPRGHRPPGGSCDGDRGHHRLRRRHEGRHHRDRRGYGPPPRGCRGAGRARGQQVRVRPAVRGHGRVLRPRPRRPVAGVRPPRPRRCGCARLHRRQFPGDPALDRSDLWPAPCGAGRAAERGQVLAAQQVHRPGAGGGRRRVGHHR